MLTLPAPFDHLHYFSVRESAGERLDHLPYCLRVLLENALRQNQTAAVNAILQRGGGGTGEALVSVCLLYTSPSPRDRTRSRMPSSA